MDGIVGDERTALEMIAEPSFYEVRMPTEQTRQIILDLCRGRALTAGELAALLNRNPHSLRARFLNPMVHEGLLRQCPSRHGKEPVYTAGAPWRSQAN